jgi:hypothetical protein
MSHVEQFRLHNDAGGDDAAIQLSKMLGNG